MSLLNWQLHGETFSNISPLRALENVAEFSQGCTTWKVADGYGFSYCSA
jgi:hypothetical protein